MFRRSKSSEDIQVSHALTPEKLAPNPPGLYSRDGVLILQSPSTDLITRFQQMDPRITYFHFMHSEFVPEDGVIDAYYKHTPITDSHAIYPTDATILTENYDLINPVGAPVNIFTRDSIEPLTEYLHQKYDGQNIAVRGTACAICDRPIEIGGRLVTNPVQIASLGTERPVDLAPQIGFGPRDDLAYRSVEWLY